MVDKEFNLSEKVLVMKWGKLYHENFIKEFIRRRNALDRLLMLKQITRQEHADRCDKLAGDDLI